MYIDDNAVIKGEWTMKIRLKRKKPFEEVKALCFDLFFTLADPHCELEKTESEPLGISSDEWSRANWCEPLASERGLGIIKDDLELIRRACSNLPFFVSDAQIEKVRIAKENRMRIAITEIRPEILETVKILKERGYKIGLISNADIFDKMHWDESPLNPYFDDTIFSCDVGLLKPSQEIYRMSLRHLGINAEEAVFIGDGGSNEHTGAKEQGMRTICMRHLMKWPRKEQKQIRKSADLILDHFGDLLRYLP